MDISYVAFWWWSSGMYQLYKTPNYQPNEAGQVLIDSINPSVSGILKDRENNTLQANIIMKREVLIQLKQIKRILLGFMRSRAHVR
jgi:hypothetical protein